MDAKIRVLFDGRPIREPLSGVARYCVSLSKALGDIQDIDVNVFVQNWKNKNIYIREIEDLDKLEIKRCHPKLFNALMEFFPYFGGGLINKEQFDLVHETYFSGLGEVKNRKKVVTIHDLIPLEFPQYFNGSVRLFAGRNLYRQCKQADHVICVSDFTKNKVLEYCPNVRKISVIPCGVEPYAGGYDSGLLEKLSLQPKSYVFYIGNIEPRKNLVKFARAFKKMKKPDEQIKFVIAGHLNYLAKEIILEITEILGNDFIYLGKVSEKDKWTLLDSAALFVFPSLYEGFGIPVIEAYYAGCPTILSAGTSLKELAVNDSQLFDPESIDDMAKCLRMFLDDKSMAQTIAKKAREYVSVFDWKNVAQKIKKIYVSVL